MTGIPDQFRKPTLKWTDIRPHLANGLIEWLQVEIRRADVETDEVLLAVAKSNSHNDYYLRGILLPDDWPTLPAEYLDYTGESGGDLISLVGRADSRGDEYHSADDIAKCRIVIDAADAP